MVCSPLLNLTKDDAFYSNTLLVASTSRTPIKRWYLLYVVQQFVMAACTHGENDAGCELSITSLGPKVVTAEVAGFPHRKAA
jgi:hypothetical protein